MIAIKYKSAIIDTVINGIESELIVARKNLIKTETVYKRTSHLIDLSDDLPEREELLEIGVKQVIQSRLYCHGYFSIGNGYFVNIARCEKEDYIRRVLTNKDSTIEEKIMARNVIAERKGMPGQLRLVPDENLLKLVEPRTTEEVIADLEADSI